ncbi:AfsR/SARP family transcriptional regulator [Micromonospora coxensis]|uniref:DNA-binding transcriptional activator of the SARP family n=1 Tax=Micromonospora coxensis TaxID=356852 RepID=A0A1C5GMN0_9ACTN|nr:AfsR/SARP family transcriptional regulator [Micromonospora coxensis]SCG34817.1 DNA-binding transcriptional activator of the SARP family [Micromonospora coxensis]
MASFSILGPLDVTVAGRPVTPRSSKQRAVLAVLLVNANRVTPLDRLLGALWRDDAPDTAVGQVQTLIWRLRGVLGEAIGTRPGGYQLSVAPGELDAEVFAGTAAEAAELARAGRLADAAARYGDALARWRGPVLADVRLPGDPHVTGFHAAVAELTEQRLAVERDRVDVEFALGRHAELIPALHRTVEVEPLREELRERLMLALHRSGRRAEALEVYRQGRQVMVAELGLEPGPALQHLHARILAGDPLLDGVDPAPAAGPAAVPAAQLPMAAADFVGRHDLAAALARHLTAGSAPDDGTPSGAPRPAAPRIVAVSGAAGSGKTTLAVQVGHLVRTHFPDGQLFVDLRGGADPLDPVTVLGRFLHALGEEPRAVPAELDERAALFRARTAGRRLLVVLDNAADGTRLRPLLPADPGCAVLVTARRRLTTLPGAHHVDLGVFTAEAAVDLLRHAIGAQRVEAEHADCLRVAARCGYLPLAIRIAGARLAARPHWPVGRLADQLADERARLDVLRTGDLAVRSSLATSYQELDPVERRLLRLLGVVDLPRVPGWAGAALLDLPLAEAEELMERLVEARLVDADRGGYRLHDLVRAYAGELRADDRPADEGPAALGRLLGGWLTLADEAYRRTSGGFRRGTGGAAARWSRWTAADLDALLADAVGWFETSRGMLTGAVRRAAAAGLHEPAWNLANTLGRFFELREHLDDWGATARAALDACATAGDDLGRAWLLRCLGELHLNVDRLDDALSCFDPALALFERLGERQGQALVLRAAGTAHRLRHDDAEAMAALSRAKAITVELGDRPGQAQVLFGLGAAHRVAGRPGPAEAAFRQALAIFRELDDRFGVAYTSTSLALVLGGRGADADAARLLRGALDLCRDLGYRRGAAICLGHLGDLHLRAGEHERAVAELTEAVTGSREVGDGIGELIALRRLGVALLALGRLPAARSALRSCLALCRRYGEDGERDRALRLLGDARARALTDAAAPSPDAAAPGQD